MQEPRVRSLVWENPTCRGNQARAPWLLSLQLYSPVDATTEAHTPWSLCSTMIDAVARRSPRTAAREQPLLAATRESNEALPAMKTKGSQIKKEKNQLPAAQWLLLEAGLLRGAETVAGLEDGTVTARRCGFLHCPLTCWLSFFQPSWSLRMPRALCMASSPCWI